MLNAGIVTRNKPAYTQLSMESYAKALSLVALSGDPRRWLDRKASKDEVSIFRSLAGEFVWLVCGSLPQERLFGSEIQQLAPVLKSHTLMGTIEPFDSLRTCRRW